MRDWFQRAMIGRYGGDLLGRAMNRAGIVLWLVSLLTGGNRWLWWIALVLWGFELYRIFSRNISRRQAENQWYLDRTRVIRQKLHQKREQFRQRKDYRFFDCPCCNTTVRVPRGKGAISITCPKCRSKFVRKS